MLTHKCIFVAKQKYRIVNTHFIKYEYSVHNKTYTFIFVSFFQEKENQWIEKCH